jgi:hypothetical protein
MVIVMAEDQTMEHPIGADGTSRAGGRVEPILPPRPTPTHVDGVLRQSDFPALPVGARPRIHLPAA